MERAQTPPPPDRADDDLVADLRRVLARVDPLPEHVRLAARWAIEWRTLDAELAELVHDSAVDEPALAVRGDAGPRVLTFETPGLTIEIETEAQDATGGDTVRVAGQLIPAQAAQIVLSYGDEMQVTSADERGRFLAGGVTRGPLSLRCRLSDTRLVETSALTI